MIWTTERVNGVTVWRADTAHDGEPVSLVVSPAGLAGWVARAGRGRTLDIALCGSSLTYEKTAEKAKARASSWAEGV